MKMMPSSQFRMVYATLGETTVVTANGHSIGVWYPRGDIIVHPDGLDVPVTPLPDGSGDGIAHLPDGTFTESRSDVVRVPIDPRPFRPVPKPSQRKHG